MTLRMLLAALIAAITVPLFASDAHAGRKVRLMYEPPDPAAELATPVVVTFEDAREEKKGGKEPNLIAQERNNMGMPIGIFSGAGKTADPPEVVPAWLVDVLEAAGYAARTEPDPSLPRVHIKLGAMWGDGQPIMGVVRHTFWFNFHLSVFPPGSDEPSWTREAPFTADGKSTTVMMRFDDPFEAGFVRAFDQATRLVLDTIATDAFQEALPGGDVEAAKAAVAEVGQQTDASGERKVGSTGVTKEDLPKGFEDWDPEVYGWGGKSTPAGFVFGAVGIGLTIGGDQLARHTALTDVQRVGSLPPVLSTQNSVAHIPYTSPDPGPAPVIKGLLGEFMYIYGVHMGVPSLAITIPTFIVATTGADIQTVKAVMGFASLSYLVPGIMMLSRFRLFPPEYALLQSQTQDAYLHIPAGVTTLAIGGVDVVLGIASGVFGALYASGALKASPTEKGLFPVVGGRGGRLKNAEAMMWLTPHVTPTLDGGVRVGLTGVW